MYTIIRVAAGTGTHSLAGSIAGKLREEGQAEVQAIGAQAVNQAIKGAAVARNFLEPNCMDMSLIPTFVDVEVDGIGVNLSHYNE